MNKDDKRQIEQLWMVAKDYYDLATSMKDNLPDDQLKLTVREFVDHCQDLSCLQKNKNLVLASAHLASSAIRLYSIDELQKKFNSKSKYSLFVKLGRLYDFTLHNESK